MSRMFTTERSMKADAEQASPPVDALTKRVFLMRPSQDHQESLPSPVDMEEKSLRERGPQIDTSGVIPPKYPTSPESYELHEVCGQGSTSKVSKCVEARHKKTFIGAPVCRQ